MVVNDNIDFKNKNLLYYIKTKPNPIFISKKINYLLNHKKIYNKISQNLSKFFLNTQNLEFETKNFIKFVDDKVIRNKPNL